MEERLVTFETAQLAKEKGFNLQVLNFYHRSKNPFTSTGLEYESDRDTYSNWNNGQGSYPTKPEDVLCSAPSQSLLQKYLRENHQIFVDVLTDCTSSPKFCLQINKFIGNPSNLAETEWEWIKIPLGDNWGLYRQYEDALEIGLQEALKTIEL